MVDNVYRRICNKIAEMSRMLQNRMWQDQNLLTYWCDKCQEVTFSPPPQTHFIKCEFCGGPAEYMLYVDKRELGDGVE